MKNSKLWSKVLCYGSIAIALFFMIFFMAKEYHEPYISSKFGFLKARFVALLLALVPAFMTYTGGQVAKGFKELNLESNYLKDKNDNDLIAQGYSKFDIFLIEAPLWGWLIWWVVCFQIMVSFHISDWLKYGF